VGEEQARCTSCGCTFWRKTDEQWKRLCLDCFKRKKAQERWQEHQRFHEPPPPPPRQPVAVIPDDMMRRLLHLCHPDKHGNSAAATEVTQWLLQRRRESR
jgi:hypothetical protein